MIKVTIELSTSEILHILECTSHFDECCVVQRVIKKVRKSCMELENEEK